MQWVKSHKPAELKGLGGKKLKHQKASSQQGLTLLQLHLPPYLESNWQDRLTTSVPNVSSSVRLVLACFTLKWEWQGNGAAEIYVILMLNTASLTRLNKQHRRNMPTVDNLRLWWLQFNGFIQLLTKQNTKKQKKTSEQTRIPFHAWRQILWWVYWACTHGNLNLVKSSHN